MPFYKLYQRSGSTWTYSGYKLNISGNTNGQLNVQSRLDPPGTGAWSAVSGAVAGGNGNPGAPQNGDTLSLPSTIGTFTTISGTGTYGSTGDKGAGYYTDQGPEQTEGDWCAGSN